MKYFCGWNIICLLCVGNAWADMYSALQSVYDTNPVIAGARTSVGVAQSDLDLARTGMRPYMGVDGNVVVSRTKIMDDTFDSTPKQISASFQQNIFQGFSTVANIKGAKSSLAASEASMYATQQDVFLDAINAYINVLNTHQVLKLNKNNEHVLQEYYDEYSDKARIGVLTSTDVAQASARLERARYQTASAQADYDNALETFRRIYGHTQCDYTEINLKRVRHLFPESVEQAAQYALKHHPAIVALNEQEAAARQNIVVAHKSISPSVDFKASATEIFDIPVVDKLRDGRFGFYLSVPLYDRGTAAANVERVRYTVAGIQEKNVNTRRIIIEQLHQAWNVYDAQTDAIEAAQAAVRASQLALDGTRDEQKNGRRTVIDVLNAEQELLNSQVSLARARHGQVAAYFAIIAGMGQLNAENLGLNVDK